MCDHQRLNLISKHRADLSHRHKNDDGTVFLGDGSLAGAPQPKLHQRGIRNVIKVVDDRCLYDEPSRKSMVTAR